MGTSGSNPLPLPNEHFVQLYRSDLDLADSVAMYALDVIDTGHAMVFFATRGHCELFRRALNLQDVDVGAAITSGQLRFVEAETFLPTIMKEGRIDPAAFEARARAALREIRRAGDFSQIHVFGELVNMLWYAGNRRATLDLERAWNALMTQEAFILYCAYHAKEPEKAIESELREAICTHGALMRGSTPDGIHQGRSFKSLVPLQARLAA